MPLRWWKVGIGGVVVGVVFQYLVVPSDWATADPAAVTNGLAILTYHYVVLAIVLF
ncbi:MAG: hypothetical protein ACE5H4_07350 [Candidatus Thorarchaeota archaeon]